MISASAPPPTTAEAALSLLQALSDPQAAAKRLSDLEAARIAHEAAAAASAKSLYELNERDAGLKVEHAKVAEELDQRAALLDRARLQHKAVVDHHEAECAQKEQQLADREARVIAADQRVKGYEVTVAKREYDVAQLEIAVREREAEVGRKHSAAEELTALNATIRADLEARLAKLRKLLS